MWSEVYLVPLYPTHGGQHIIVTYAYFQYCSKQIQFYFNIALHAWFFHLFCDIIWNSSWISVQSRCGDIKQPGSPDHYISLQHWKDHFTNIPFYRPYYWGIKSFFSPFIFTYRIQLQGELCSWTLKDHYCGFILHISINAYLVLVLFSEVVSSWQQV